MTSGEKPNSELSRVAFGDVLLLLGGTVVLRTLLDEAERARLEQGSAGIVFTDACEDEPPTLKIALRADEVEFCLGAEPSHVLPLAEVEAMVAAAEAGSDAQLPPAA